MRGILFRGKNADNGEWVYGYYWANELGNHFIRVTEEDYNYVLEDYEILSETVGEYTGLTDKNGKKIFEGDIIRSNSERGYIEYYPNDCAFDVVDDHGFYWLISEMSNIEVIGNIHDNPELLYARCKDKEVFIYDEQGNEVKLTEYIAKHAQEECEVTAEDIMEGCCFECMDCPLGILNTVAIQAAELRHRLTELEDLLERDVLTNPKGLTKEQILWAYEMDVGILKNEIKRLKKELKEDE